MRQPKPYKFRQWWVTRMGGTLTKLAPVTKDKDKGEKAAKETLTALLEERAKQQPAPIMVALLTVRKVAADYCELLSVNKPGTMVRGKPVEHKTVKHYRDNLKKLVNFDMEQGRGFLGDKAIAKVTLQDGVDYKKALQRDGWRKTWVVDGIVHQSGPQPYSVVKINHFIRSA